MMIILLSLSALFPAPQSYRITFFITRGVHYIMNSWIVMACSKKLSFSTLIMNPKYFDQTNHAIKTQAQLSCPAKLSRQPYKFRHKSLRKYVGRIICIESWWPLFPTLEFYSHSQCCQLYFSKELQSLMCTSKIVKTTIFYQLILSARSMRALIHLAFLFFFFCCLHFCKFRHLVSKIQYKVNYFRWYMSLHISKCQ